MMHLKEKTRFENSLKPNSFSFAGKQYLDKRSNQGLVQFSTLGARLLFKTGSNISLSPFIVKGWI